MAPLNKKNGNLRGVIAYIQNIPGAGFEEISAQGWAVSVGEDKFGFVVNMIDPSGLVAEITISEKSLHRMIEEIDRVFFNPELTKLEPQHICKCNDNFTYTDV